MEKIRRHFQKLIWQQFPAKANRLIAEIAKEFFLIEKDIAFAVSSKNLMDKRMPIAAYLLAVIKVLDKEGLDYNTIQGLILEHTQQLARPKNRIDKLIKRLIPKLLTFKLSRFILQRIGTRARKYSHKDGFLFDVLTAKEQTLGFGYGLDILECGICKLFQTHKLQKYTSIMCEVDYITSTMADLKLIRTGTIANGARKCDFRYAYSSKRDPLSQKDFI